MTQMVDPERPLKCLVLVVEYTELSLSVPGVNITIELLSSCVLKVGNHTYARGAAFWLVHV